MDDNRKGRLDGQVYRLLKTYWFIGWALVVALVLWFYSSVDLIDAITSSWIRGTSVTLLLAGTLLWFVAYLQVTYGELEMLYKHGFTLGIRAWNWFPLLVIIILSSCFAALFATINNVLFYSGFAIFLMIINASSFSVVQKVIYDATQDKHRVQRVPDAIAAYYLGRHFLPHQVGMLVGFFVAFVVSLVAHYDQKETLRFAATLIVLAVIVVGEVIVIGWRRRRDAKLT